MRRSKYLPRHVSKSDVLPVGMALLAGLENAACVPRCFILVTQRAGTPSKPVPQVLYRHMALWPPTPALHSAPFSVPPHVPGGLNPFAHRLTGTFLPGFTAGRGWVLPLFPSRRQVFPAVTSLPSSPWLHLVPLSHQAGSPHARAAPSSPSSKHCPS